MKPCAPKQFSGSTGKRPASACCRVFKWGLRFGVLCVLALLTGGCITTSAGPVVTASPYRADNVFVLADKLPGETRRVAVLPLSCDSQRSDLAAGKDALEATIIGELIKTRKFEVVRVEPAAMRRLTGQGEWSGEELLPESFLKSIREATGCDAILFTRLTDFRAYAPLAVGWRLKLVDARAGYVIWAGDELFDAAKPSVVTALRRYLRQERVALTGGDNEWAFMNSPRRFGQYAAAQMFDTLPAR